MSRPPKDEAREQRIRDEAVVDAYGAEEQAMGWFYYLEDKLGFPFKAVCDRHRPISALNPGQCAEVTGMAPEDECLREMFVTVCWEKEQPLAVPLMQLDIPEMDDEGGEIEIDEDTAEAIADWRYWWDRGYRLAD